MSKQFKMVLDTGVIKLREITKKIVELDKEENLPIMSGSFAMLDDAFHDKIKIFKIEKPIITKKRIPELKFL